MAHSPNTMCLSYAWEKHYVDCCLLPLTPFDRNGARLITNICYNDNSFMRCRLKDGHFNHYKWGDEVTWTRKSNVIFCKGNLYLWENDWSLVVVDSIFPHNFSNVKMRNTHNICSVKMGEVCCYVMVESSGEISMVRISRDHRIILMFFEPTWLRWSGWKWKTCVIEHCSWVQIVRVWFVPMKMVQK